MRSRASASSGTLRATLTCGLFRSGRLGLFLHLLVLLHASLVGGVSSARGVVPHTARIAVAVSRRLNLLEQFTGTPDRPRADALRHALYPPRSLRPISDILLCSLLLCAKAGDLNQHPRLFILKFKGHVWSLND